MNIHQIDSKQKHMNPDGRQLTLRRLRDREAEEAERDREEEERRFFCGGMGKAQGKEKETLFLDGFVACCFSLLRVPVNLIIDRFVWECDAYLVEITQMPLLFGCTKRHAKSASTRSSTRAFGTCRLTANSPWRRYKYRSRGGDIVSLKYRDIFKFGALF